MARGVLEDALFDESTNEAIRDALPEAAITAFEYVTHLGDGATLIVFATLLYWFGAESRREQRALVIAIGLGALAISAGMKGIFLRPRPELAGGYGGYSFPSAHALGGAAFYGALAVVADTGTRRQRYVAAGTVIALIAVSRVVIGVHYVGDVVVGVAIGLAFVALVVRGDDSEPGTIFGLAGVIAVLAFALGSREFTTMTIGAAVGATLAWQYVAGRTTEPRGAAIVLLAALCLPVVFVLRAIPVVWPAHPLVAGLEIVGYAIATAAVLVVPIVADRMNDWPAVVWLQDRLPFSGRTIDREQESIGTNE
ncbi:phosphatase PAP2 family protein [Natronolimnohabitans innermongolicus]|uniref:PA-phosphatase-like phosphoesterase n=1 Tax=Natronolimnohabitans innermongolicus JCM 12255 TaxID=1227499 RepID=L9X4H4_9EURY|nr:phosphatase PAP2 family protein [Natronolimnohabitans innermongolicus]ELY56689.1 PA-phosphatase-like phosphoesterase [Natronolimnohabitans innermongolicus JCM 12255]